MKLEGYLFVAGAVFWAAIAAIYWLMAKEPAGTTALVLLAGFAILVAYYLLYTSSHIDPRPEDQLDAEIADGAGEYGFFSPHSWWPLPLAASGAVIFFGIVFAWWIVAFGAFMFALSAIGFVFEYYRNTEIH